MRQPVSLSITLPYLVGASPGLDAHSDNQLIQEAINGSLEAFEALVRRYQDRLIHSLEHALGSREDALDAGQQAFISAWRKLATFRQDSAFYTWLYRIAMNAAITRKRKQRLPTTSLDHHISSTGNSPADTNLSANPDSRLVSEENVRLVQEALMELPEEFRQPLVMKELDDFSYEEIGTILEIPIGTVRSRIFRARKELTERLGRLFPSD